jgi:hypothetical protein
LSISLLKILFLIILQKYEPVIEYWKENRGTYCTTF